MTLLQERFDGYATPLYMLACDHPSCGERFDDSQWSSDPVDLMNDARFDAGWQVIYADEHPEADRDLDFCSRHRLPECVTCDNIKIGSAGWRRMVDGGWQCPECVRLEVPAE